MSRHWLYQIPFIAVLLIGVLTSPLSAEDAAVVTAARGHSEELAKAFNAGNVDAVVALFAAKGELIDDHGNVHQGAEELKSLLTAFFTKFPKAKLKLEVESVRELAPSVAIEDGVRTITAGEKEENAVRLRYTMVSALIDGKWKVVSLREAADEQAASPHDSLQSLAWLVGDWVNEGTDAVVKISYHWSEDQNYILADFGISRDGKAANQSTQRIGFDSQTGRIRSWLFDADGGFTEGFWAMVDDHWIIKSSGTNPDGAAASATITITPQGKDRFTIKGSDRVVGAGQEPDFEVSVVRRPPAASK